MENGGVRCGVVVANVGDSVSRNRQSILPILYLNGKEWDVSREELGGRMGGLGYMEDQVGLTSGFS